MRQARATRKWLATAHALVVQLFDPSDVEAQQNRRPRSQAASAEAAPCGGVPSAASRAAVAMSFLGRKRDARGPKTRGFLDYSLVFRVVCIDDVGKVDVGSTHVVL